MLVAGVLAAVKRKRLLKKQKKFLGNKEDSLSKIKRLQKLRDNVAIINRQNLSPRLHSFATAMVRIECSQWFSTAVIVVILCAGISAGISTYESLQGHFLKTFDNVIVGMFILEAVVKLLSKGKQPWIYFKDGWNVFDFSIIVLNFVPLGFDFTTLRLLRVLKLLNAIAPLRILVVSLLKSTKAIGYVLMLLGLVFYLYSVMACFLFKQNDPFHFRNLQLALLSLYRVSTFEDWTDIMYINMYGCNKYGYSLDPNRTKLYSTQRLPEFMFCTDPSANPVVSSLFFCSFTLVTAMILFKLFIGVILTNISKAEAEYKEELMRDLAQTRLSRKVLLTMRYSTVKRQDSVVDTSNMTPAQLRWSKLRTQVLTGNWRSVFAQEPLLKNRQASQSVSLATQITEGTVEQLLDTLSTALDRLEANLLELSNLNREWESATLQPAMAGKQSLIKSNAFLLE